MIFREPYWSIFVYYKVGREALRFFCVTLLVVLNTIIAKSLQIAKVYLKYNKLNLWKCLEESQITH
jgi:hypothetical protein